MFWDFLEPHKYVWSMEKINLRVLTTDTLTRDIDNLNEVLKYLKPNKSRDALGYHNKNFKPEVIGSNLKLAILKLMNEIKKQQTFPDSLELCNVTSIYKKKGKKSDLKNYREIEDICQYEFCHKWI